MSFSQSSVPTPVPTSSNQGPKIALLVFLGVAVGFGIAGWTFLWPEHVNEQLIKTGVPAEATILSADPTGNVYNSQPQVRLKLEVRPKDGEAYQAETKMIINPVYIPQFQPGRTVRVRYDQNDKSKIAIEETENGQR